MSRVSELDHIQHVWQEYKDNRRDLELLLTQERELLQRIAFSQELEMEGYKAGVESDLKVVSVLKVSDRPEICCCKA